MSVLYEFLANLAFASHVAFSLFGVLGGFLCIAFPRFLWAHVPTVIWGFCALSFDLTCPLTTLEDHLRGLYGGERYEEGFLEDLLPIVFPADYPSNDLPEMAIDLLGITAFAYSFVGIRLWRSRRRAA